MDRNPVGARFFVSVQTGPGAQLVSNKIGTGLFVGGNLTGYGADHPSPSSAEVKENVELYLYPPQGLYGLF